MMNLLHAILLGIVEGITEFLPVSSTGHLILSAQLLGLEQSEFLKSFEIIIQFGAIAAVAFFYRKKLLREPETWKRVGAAFIPTALIGFLLYKLIKKFLLANTQIVLLSLFLGGVFLIVFEKWHRKNTALPEKTFISYKQAIAIGFFQTLAVIPGVSRSAATIVGGLLLGLPRKTVVEFSFLLALPTLLAAASLDCIKSASSFSWDQTLFLSAGFLSSFAVAFFVIQWLLRYIEKHDFTLFGIYRILLAFLFWFFV